MNRKPTFRPLAVAALLAAIALPAAHSETWQILLPSPGSAPSGLGGNLLVNPYNSTPAAGVFLAIGKSSLEGPAVPSILRLTPTDATSANFAMESIDGGLVGGRLGHNPGDGLYIAGYSATTSGNKGNTQTILSWKVRRSGDADQGNPNTWRDDDSYQISGVTKGKLTKYNSRAHALTTDDAGNVYVSGWAYDGKVNHWIVRKKTASGWSKIYDAAATDGYSIPYGIRFVPAGGNNPVPALLLVGLFNNRWTVLRSTTAGATWTPVGPWPADGSLASANDVASDGHGNVYICGVRGRDGQNRGWVVRKSSDGGTSWETLLDQPSSVDSWAVRLTIDTSNTITVAGAIDAADGSPRWVIVRNSPGQAWFGSPTASWETRVWPFGQNATAWSKGRGMAGDAAGNLFLTGDVIDWTDPADGTAYPGTRASLLRFVP